MNTRELLTQSLTDGGIHCLLALGFTFVWWSSRTFFITAGGLVILGGVITRLFVLQVGWSTLASVVASLLLCSAIGVLLELALFERYALRMTRESKVSSTGSFGNIVLDTAIVSFALYLLLVNGIQWCFRGMTDTISLRPHAPEQFKDYSLFGFPLGIRTNRLGLWQLVTCWVSSFFLTAILSSRIGLKLRAAKSNFALFDQITGQGRQIRLLSFALCSAAAAFVGNVLLYTARVDIDGGLNTVLGAMVVMILGTQSKSLYMIPIFSLLLAAISALLQARGFSLWVEPVTFSFLLAVLIFGPRGIISDVRRAEELVEA